MLQDALDEALDPVELRPAHALYLLDHVFEVEIIRQLAPRRRPAEHRRLLCRPSQDVAVVKIGPVHPPPPPEIPIRHKA
jgi:hypothetical protein